MDAPETWLNELLASLSGEWQWMMLPAGVWLLVLMAGWCNPHDLE